MPRVAADTGNRCRLPPASVRSSAEPIRFAAHQVAISCAACVLPLRDYGALSLPDA